MRKLEKKTKPTLRPIPKNQLYRAYSPSVTTFGGSDWPRECAVYNKQRYGPLRGPNTTATWLSPKAEPDVSTQPQPPQADLYACSKIMTQPLP